MNIRGRPLISSMNKIFEMYYYNFPESICYGTDDFKNHFEREVVISLQNGANQ